MLIKKSLYCSFYSNFRALSQFRPPQNTSHALTLLISLTLSNKSYDTFLESKPNSHFFKVLVYTSLEVYTKNHLKSKNILRQITINESLSTQHCMSNSNHAKSWYRLMSTPT